MKKGRPTDYSEEMLSKAQEYIKLCEDTEEQVNLPTRGGLAAFLDVSRDTLYEWAKHHPDFSYIMERLGATQEDRLINKGLAGQYNSTIAKVLLTKHGYREGIDQTTKDQALPQPLLNVLRNNNSDTETSETQKED